MTFYTPSDQDREELKQPHGETVQGEQLIRELEKRDYEKIIAVGDQVSRDIANSEVSADISIVDGNIQREHVGKSHFQDIDAERTLKTGNSAGEISEDAWKTVRKASAFECETKVIVEGEEDLLALPALLFAPSDAVIVYGHWEEGAVLMEATEENRDFVEGLIDMEKSKHLIVGGSWDIFHSGHRYIILTALTKAEKIDLGITSEQMIKSKLGHDPVNSFNKRKQDIEQFIESLGRSTDVRLIEINDIYGNAVEEGDKLLVTPETEQNAVKINECRAEQGKEDIELEIVEKLEAVDEDPISSTRLRDDGIDVNGV